MTDYPDAPGPIAAKGERIELIACTDEYTRLERGEKGTVTHVDALGTVHVAWDSGSTLGLVYAAGDRWRPLPEKLPQTT